MSNSQFSDIQFKANSGQFNIDQAQGVVECFVAGIGNKDSVGDIVISGAFAKSLIRRKPRVVWGHNWNDPIGKVLEIYEVPPNDPRLPAKMKMAGIGGLYAKVQFNLNSEKGREAFANVAFFGEEQEWSIGYKTLDAIYDNNRQANILREVELYEVSPVLHGANQLTGTISVKSDEEKMHMMGMMGMPGMVAVEEKPKGPNDPFEQGIAQPADSDRTAALERELMSRTGGPVKVMKATESSVVFLKPGKGVFRLGYYFDGEQYMFGKPEKLGMPQVPAARPMPSQPMPYGMPGVPGMSGKPNVNPNMMRVRYGDEDDSASGIFSSVRPKDDEKSLIDELGLLLIEEKTDDATETIRQVVNVLQGLISEPHDAPSEYVIKCAVEDAFATKQALDPVFDFHRIESYVSEDGIVVASPMTQEAFEAVENATKGLGRRIGRALGGGGKVRRGRAALSRVEGELDPRKRRDSDGDGKIFDNTPWERAATPRIDTALRSQSDVPPPKKNKKIGERALDPTKPRKDIKLTRQEQKKLVEMIDAVVKDGGIEDNSPIKQVADAIRNSATMPYGQVPDISPELFDAFKKEYAGVKDKFQNAGARKEGQRGRSAFDILDEFVETGKYSRTNLGTDKRTKKGEVAMSGRPTGALETPAKSRQDLIDKFLPKDWQTMEPDEKFDWWFANSQKLKNESNSAEWRRMLNALEADIVKEDEAFEKKKKRRSVSAEAQRTPVPKTTTTPAQPKPEEKPKAPKVERSRDTDKFTESGQAISTYIDKHKAQITDDFSDVAKSGIDEMATALADNDGEITANNLKEAQEAIEKTVAELQELAKERKKKLKKRTPEQEAQNINRGEDEVAASKREQDIISGLKFVSQQIGEEYQKLSKSDEEDELNPETDIFARFESPGEMDDIEDVVSRSMSVARSYTSSRNRRREGIGLRSSRSGDGGRAPRTEVVAESTWWKSVLDSLPREIREADSDDVKRGLNLLKDTLNRQDAAAFRPNSKRTNVGSLRITADEADLILDSVMAVLDRQMTAGKDGGVGSRAEIFAELLEKISRASMSTFIDKTSGPADDDKRKNR